MTKIVKKRDKIEGSLDTLAQVPPKPKNSIEILSKRARSKWYTEPLIVALKYLEGTKLRKYYSHAWNCNNIIYQEGQKYTSRYCNTRVCNICSRIRTAKLMNGYVSQLMKLDNIEFVTLTVPNCTYDDLNDCVDNILRQIVLILRNLREKKGIKLSGIRKLEITYNSRTKTFHPHLHLLVNNNSGKLIVDQWLKRMPTAKIIAQDVRKADSGALSEIFKYTTKMVVRVKGQLNFHLKPINAIMECLYKRRCFQPFGIVKMVDENVDELDANVYPDMPDNGGGITEWPWKECDWINGKNTLTGYIPPEIERNIIE